MGRTTHGLTNTPEYMIWAGMKHRCKNTNLAVSNRYADRGITVCDRWKDFNNFIQDMGYRPDANCELDRIDNSKGYTPDNCRWVDKQTNLDNREYVVKTIINGEELTLADISEKYNLSAQSVYRRWLKGERGDTLIRPQDNRGRPKKNTLIRFRGLTLTKEVKQYKRIQYYV